KHPEAVKDTLSVDVKKLVEDLHIQQIELEMQNDELRKIQQKLEASRDLYSDLYNFSPDGHMTVSDKGFILEANLTIAAMLGMERIYLIGKLLSRFIPRKDQDRYHLFRKNLLERKTLQSFELRLIKNDCTQFYAQLHGIASEDPEENTAMIRYAVTDITERKRVEKALRYEKEKLSSIFEAMNDGVCIINQQYDFEYLNPLFLKEFGPVEGLKCYTYFNGRTDICPWCRNQKVFSGEIVRWEWQSQKNNKTYDIIETPLRNADGTISKLEIFRDITNYRKLMEKLEQSEERYRSLMKNIPDVTWTTNFKGETSYISPNIEKVYGYTPEEIYQGGASLWIERIHPDDAGKVKEALKNLIEKGTKFDVEYRIKRKDGKWIWLHDRSIAAYEEDGMMKADGIFSDFTNRKRTEEALQKSHNSLEEKVKERTVQLIQINEKLKLEIEEHKTTEENLRNALNEIKELKEHLEAEKKYLQEEIKSEHNYENIIGNSKALRNALYKVEKIAPTDTTVLILGETGTGKELIARSIHDSSPRRHRAFVKVNCATLPSNLMESELFGHEKGAFSGAVAKRVGRFELADGATIFLDEIGELPLALQSKLLRVLEDGEFERVGSSQTVKVDVRIIAATNRDLEAEVRSGRFRQDLWFRLNVFPITMPPLRNRKKDIPMLVEFFAERISNRLGRSIDVIPKSVMGTFQNYHWPGNVRELQHVIERAVINASGNKLHLMDDLDTSKKDLSKIPKTMEKVEYDHIVRMLEETQWKVDGKNGAAEILGLNPSTLRGRMRKLGIKKPKTSHF
ncbi:MAG: sigma 54-interacting transcriptional regulator, partial [Desulfobacterales bacterium]